MVDSNLRGIENETLATFREHRPSEYFSHIVDDNAYWKHHQRVEELYRFGLMLPPEIFMNKSVIDLGAGTGEHTISLALWGAECHLVELNAEAIDVARQVFESALPEDDFRRHTFSCESLFDVDTSQLRHAFDFAHSRGVFTHVADKARAFNILAQLVKPGGYVIYGDRNTSGGVQEMLQRFAIFTLVQDKDSSQICAVAEALFSEDIDRSQRALPRTREAIIYDRWVIQQQDDPSVGEVLSLFRSNGVEYVSSWPRLDFVGRGPATHSPVVNEVALNKSGAVAEALWMMENGGQIEDVDSLLPGTDATPFFSQVESLASHLRNLRYENDLSVNFLRGEFANMKHLGETYWDTPAKYGTRLQVFCAEVDSFLKALDEAWSLPDMRRLVDSFEILFKGFAGVRHVDYVGYKPQRPSKV